MTGTWGLAQRLDIIVIVVVVMMVVMAPHICTGFGIERRLDFVHMASQVFDHIANYVIGANADAVVQQLHRQVAVAEVPCDPHKLAFLVRMNLQQFLRLGADLYHAAVVQREPVAMAQPHCLRQIEHDFGPCFGTEQDAAAVASVVVDQDTMGGRRGIPGADRQYFMTPHQKRKYRCAIGRIVAGSQVSSTPSARTS